MTLNGDKRDSEPARRALLVIATQKCGSRKSPVEQLITCHSCYYNDKRAEFKQKLVSITPNA
jgi:hypothetical protein